MRSPTILLAPGRLSNVPLLAHAVPLMGGRVCHHHLHLRDREPEQRGHRLPQTHQPVRTPQGQWTHLGTATPFSTAAKAPNTPARQHLGP